MFDCVTKLALNLRFHCVTGRILEGLTVTDLEPDGIDLQHDGLCAQVGGSEEPAEEHPDLKPPPLQAHHQHPRDSDPSKPSPVHQTLRAPPCKHKHTQFIRHCVLQPTNINTPSPSDTACSTLQTQTYPVHQILYTPS